MTSRKPKALLAEDDERLRPVLAEMLAEEYEVTIVTTGKELYALLCGCRELYAAVVTDIVMPHWHGTEGVELAKAFGANLPVVYMSGWIDPTRESDLADAEFLAKPFEREALFAAIRRARDKAARVASSA